MTRYRGFLAALLGAGTLILFSPSAHASPPTETKTIQVRAEYTEPMPGFDGVQCRGLEKNEPWCQAVMPGPVTFTGTISGEARAESAGPTRDVHHYDGPDFFEHAVVQGCGEGGLILETFEGDFDFADTRLEDQSTGGYNKWRVRPDSGTGTLAGIRGEGENHWRPYWTETGDRWGRGTFTGTITCEVPRAAHRRVPTETRTVTIRSEHTAPMSQPSGVSCLGLASETPWCQANFVTDVTLTGNLAGVASFRDAGPTRDGHHASGTAAFDHAVVDGCGEGAIVFDAVADFDVANTNPADLTTPASETWTLRPQSGTGGLAGVVSADLRNDWVAHWTNAEQWARGVLTGTITCEVPKHDDKTSTHDERVKGADGAIVLASAAEAPGTLPATGGAPYAATIGTMVLASGLAVRRVAVGRTNPAR